MQAGQQGVRRQRKGSFSVSPKGDQPLQPLLAGSCLWPQPHEYALQRGIPDPTPPSTSLSKIPPKKYFQIRRMRLYTGRKQGKSGRDSNPSRFSLSSLTLSPAFLSPAPGYSQGTWLIQTKSNKLLQQNLEGIPSGSWHVSKLSAPSWDLLRRVMQAVTRDCHSPLSRACILPGNGASPSQSSRLLLIVREQDSPHSPISLPQTHVFHITAEEMPSSIKNTCRALIIKQSLAGAQVQEQLCAFKSRWKWCPAPAAACQPADTSTRVRLVLPRAPGLVTREAGQHHSLNQPTEVVSNLHHSPGPGPSGSRAGGSPGQPRLAAGLPGSVSLYLGYAALSTRVPGGEQRCLPQHIHQLCKHKLFLTSLISWAAPKEAVITSAPGQGEGTEGLSTAPAWRAGQDSPSSTIPRRWAPGYAHMPALRLISKGLPKWKRHFYFRAFKKEKPPIFGVT